MCDRARSRESACVRVRVQLLRVLPTRYCALVWQSLKKKKNNSLAHIFMVSPFLLTWFWSRLSLRDWLTLLSIIYVRCGWSGVVLTGCLLTEILNNKRKHMSSMVIGLSWMHFAIESNSAISLDQNRFMQTMLPQWRHGSYARRGGAHQSASAKRVAKKDCALSVFPLNNARKLALWGAVTLAPVRGYIRKGGGKPR